MQFRPGDLVMYLPWGPGAPVETVLVIVENDYDDVGEFHLLTSFTDPHNGRRAERWGLSTEFKLARSR